MTTMPRSYTIDVQGLPRPQGSLTLFRAKNGHEVAKYPQPVIAWRMLVQQTVANLELEPMIGAVELRLGFQLPRPLHHFLPPNSKRSKPELRATAPEWVTVAPDLDKLTRAICDSCTDAGLWKDDAQVVYIQAAKRYVVPPAVAGVRIVVTELEQPYD